MELESLAMPTLCFNTPNEESYGNLGKRLVSGRGYNYNYANGGDDASTTHSSDGDGGSNRLVPALSGIVIRKGHHTVAPKDLAGQGLCGAVGGYSKMSDSVQYNVQKLQYNFKKSHHRQPPTNLNSYHSSAQEKCLPTCVFYVCIYIYICFGLSNLSCLC